jgi:hypothetical protein
VSNSKPKLGGTFRSVAEAIARSKSLANQSQEHLDRWRQDDRAADIWTAITARIGKKYGELANIYCKVFVEEVLTYRELLVSDYVHPEYLERAKDAERLARFLRGSSNSPPRVEPPTKKVNLLLTSGNSGHHVEKHGAILVERCLAPGVRVRSGFLPESPRREVRNREIGSGSRYPAALCRVDQIVS